MNATSGFFAFTSALLLSFAGISAASGQTVDASVLASGYSSSGLENVGVLDLSASGTTDWVHFAVNGTSTAFNLTNEKSGGPVGGLDTVGAVSESGAYTGGGTFFAGRTQNTSNMNVSYDNGASPLSSTSTVSGSPAGKWSVQTGYGGGAFTNAGLSFTIDFNQAISSGHIYLAANNYVDGSTPEIPTLALNASLGSGASSTVDVTDSGVNNLYDIFDIAVGNIAEGDSLTLSFTMFNGAGNDNVSFSGVALDLTAAPEPSTYALLGGGMVCLIALGRFRARVS